MGDQNYGLRGLARFSDNEGAIIWPAWRAELKQLVEFEIGTTGNKIIEGERHVVPRNIFVSVGRFLNFAARSTRSRVSDAVVTICTRGADRAPAGRIASTSAARRLARESFVGGREDGDERRRPNLETATMTEAELACRRVCVRHRGRG